MSSNREIPIDVTSRHGDLSDRMEDYATKKAQRLCRFHGRISRIEVIVDGPHDAPDVEMIVHVDGGGPYLARERATRFSVAVDSLTDKLERQLVKAKEKLTNHKVESIRGMEPTDPDADEGEETYEDIVRKDLDS